MYQILLTISVVYGILLFAASEYESSVFSVFISLGLYSVLQSVFRKEEKFDIAAPAIVIVGSVAKIVWTILVNSVDVLANISLGVFPSGEGESYVIDIAVDIVLIVVSIVLIILSATTKYLTDERESAPFRCHIVFTLIFSVLACLVDTTLYHIVLVLSFTFLFSKWTLTDSSTNCYLSSSARNIYTALYYLDIVIWETSSYWSSYIPGLSILLPVSTKSHILSKFLLALAFSFLQMIPEGDAAEKPPSTAEVKARWRTKLERLRKRLSRSLYHYVNSPFGIFIQNALIIFWIFLYPSVATILLLVCSTLNMLFVKAYQIENVVLISPRRWTQKLLNIYVQLIGLYYFAFSSGLSKLLQDHTTVYYLLLGGLTDFKGVNWFIWVFIFYLGWCGIMTRDLDAKKVCYPAYLKVPSPEKVYRYLRVVVLIACVLTCIVSPDLTLGILLIVFIFANYCNLWMVQVVYSALISALKIFVGLYFSIDTNSDWFALFGLKGGVASQLQPVNVCNFYSLVNGIIMALAGFNYLALCYEKHVNTHSPPQQHSSHQRFYKNIVWVLYLVYYLTIVAAIPSYMTAISLFLLSLIVIVHIGCKESLALWWIAVVVEALLFLYGYLNMFSMIAPFLHWGIFENVKDLELGLFVTKNIVNSVSRGEVFFYLLHFFVRIFIAVSRITYLQRKPQPEEKAEEVKEEHLSDYFRYSTILKLFIYNHFPKVLLAFVVLISYVEEDAMSYILFTIFLVSLVCCIKKTPRWSGIYMYYAVPAAIFVVCRYVAQFTWNYYQKNNDAQVSMWRCLKMAGMIRFVTATFPEVYPSIDTSLFWTFTRQVFRSIVYYFLVIVISAFSRMVSEMGTSLMEKLHDLESKEEEDRRSCKVKIEDRYGEVYRLSTIVMRGMYLRLKDQATESLNEYTQEQQRLLDEELEMQQAIVSGAVDSEEELTPEEEEQLHQMEATPRRAAPVSKQPFVFRIFKSYVESHKIPTPHIMWLRIKKNLLLLHSQLIQFIDDHLLDIIRLINIGMMTIACGTDSFDSLLNLVLILPMTCNLKSYSAAPVVASILSVLLFLEYVLYIFPDNALLAELLHMDNFESQARNYLMIANISSVYMVPNTVTMVCCWVQYQLSKETKPETPQVAAEPAVGAQALETSSASSPSSPRMGAKEVELSSVPKIPTLRLPIAESRETEEEKSREGKRRTALEILLEWMTIELHDIMLIVIFLASVMNKNLFSLVYLIFSLYFLFRPSVIKQRNNKASMFIKWYAYIHLAIIVIYQIPLFPEPSTCELTLQCPNWHRLFGLNKMVYQHYAGNPRCSPDPMLVGDASACPHPYQFDEGILSIVIINIIVNIHYLVQSSSFYDIVSRRDSKKAFQSILNRTNLISTWKRRLERRQREVATITSLLYNQLCIILNKVLYVDKQLFASKDKKFTLPPTILGVDITSPYSASITFQINEKTWPIEDTIKGFVVGVIEERTDDVPDMNHIELEVFFPNEDIIHNHEVTVDVTQLKPCTPYKFTLYCLFSQGRTTSIMTEESYTTPPTKAVDTYLWSVVCAKIDHFVYNNMQEFSRMESFNRQKQQIGLDELAEITSRKGTGDEGLPRTPKRIHFEPVTNSQLKDLEEFDMLINTQTRSLRLRKKEKDEACYDLCRVVNARYFPDEEDSDRDYLRLIVQWDTLKLDYVYIFRAKERSKGFNVHQLIEWFNMVLPHRVLMNTMEVQERFDEKDRHATIKVLEMFKTPESKFPKKWKTYRNLEKVFTVLLLLYLILRDDLVSLCITLFYLCFASLFCIHVPYSFYNIVSWILTAVIIIRFLVQTSLVSQYIVDGSWRLSGMTNSQSPFDGFNPSSFQLLHILGFFKTNKDYSPPIMSSLFWDLLFLLLFNLCKSYQRSFSLQLKSADDELLEEAMNHSMEEKKEEQKTVIVDSTMPVRDLIHKETDPRILRFRRYPAWLKRLLLKIFPDMYNYADPEATTHPFKFGRDYYTPILITQMILAIYVFFFYSSMTETNYAFSNSVSSGTIQTGTVIWICLIVVLIVLERILNVKRMLFVKCCAHIVITIALHIYCFLYVPIHTQTHFLHNGYLVFFYLICLVYILLSVLQIRQGYPTKDQYIQKVVKMDYSSKPYIINMVYRMIPFLYELNCLIDWSVTETSCDIWNYMRVEEIRNTMFIGKYKSLSTQKDSLKNRGEARGRTEKIIWGFSMIFIIVLLLLLPLMLFSSDSSALVSNPVKFASMDVNLVIMGEPLNLYSFSRSSDIVDVSRDEYYRWQNLFKVNGKTVLLPKWTTESQIINIPSVSNYPWSVLEDYTDRVVNYISNDCSNVYLDLQIMFDRDLPSEAQTTTEKITRTLNQTQCDTLVKMLSLSSISSGTQEPLSLVFENLYPRIYFLNSENEPVSYDTNSTLYNSLEIELKASRSSLFGMQYYWEVRSDTPDTSSFQNGVLFWVINETQLSQLLASSISSLGSASITGLYVIVLITVGTYFRGFLVPDVATIAYVTMPDPLLVLELICGLYITRIDQYKGHLKDENKICDMVIAIIRNNAMLVRLTEVQPLYGVLQMKDELDTTNDVWSSESGDDTSVLPLISSVIQNMRTI